MDTDGVVYIIEDDPAVRRLLAADVDGAGLRGRPFASAEEFLEHFNGSEYGCALVDLRLGGMSGLDLLQALRSRSCAIPVIMISAFGDVASAVSTMKLGAVDFIQKPFGYPELIAKLRAAVTMDKARHDELGKRADIRRRLAGLTAREQELLRLLAEGKSSKMIAGELGLSPKTVENHRTHLLAKTHAQNVADLVRIWMLANETGRPGESAGSKPL